jgi:hypothetical protein
MVDTLPQRFTNQDWESREMRFFNDMSAFHSRLLKMKATAVEAQRFNMSDTKEKDLFMSKGT